MAIQSKCMFLCVFFCLLCMSCSSSNSSLPGYIEGEYTYISSGISGTLFKIFVKRGQAVNQGEILYQLDPQPEQAKVETSKANIADLQAQFDFLKVQLKRQKALYFKNFAAKADLDQAQSNYDSKAQQIVADIADLTQTQWALQQKTLYAPISGQVFDVFYRIGEKVEENHPVLALLAPENIKVLFYLPESLLSQIKIGQTIAFTCDSCKGKTRASVSYISPEAEYTPPVIYSKDTRHKLVYLIRAALPADIAAHFHPGQPIEVYLHP